MNQSHFPTHGWVFAKNIPCNLCLKQTYNASFVSSKKVSAPGQSWSFYAPTNMALTRNRGNDQRYRSICIWEREERKKIYTIFLPLLFLIVFIGVYTAGVNQNKHTYISQMWFMRERKINNRQGKHIFWAKFKWKTIWIYL